MRSGWVTSTPKASDLLLTPARRMIYLQRSDLRTSIWSATGYFLRILRFRDATIGTYRRENCISATALFLAARYEECQTRAVEAVKGECDCHCLKEHDGHSEESALAVGMQAILWSYAINNPSGGPSTKGTKADEFD